MVRIANLVNNEESSVRVYLLKKIRRSDQYEAVIFPNEIEENIKKTYTENYNHFCGDKSVVDYDSVHSEKNTIKKLPLHYLSYWTNMINAIHFADKNRVLLNKNNFTDDYSVIILVYEKVKRNQPAECAYLISQYRKVESWYKRSVKFAFVANAIKQKNEEIFVLNGCIDTAIINEDVFILQETAFEKIFNYYERSKRIVESNKLKIEKWMFLDNPQIFYTDVLAKKNATIKLARALEKSSIDFSTLEPFSVKRTLTSHSEFNNLSYDDKDRIIYGKGTRDLIIDILRCAYTRNLFSESLVHTKGV